MQKEKYGFVYIWHDRKRKMFYVGAHWGTEDDGYICSSTHMRNAYKKRPEDFKRRIIIKNIKREDISSFENYFLKLIKPEELGKKYYNKKTHGIGYPGIISEDTKQKIRIKSLEQWADPEKRLDLIEKTRLGMQNEIVRSKMIGRIVSEKTRKIMSEQRKGKKPFIFTEEIRKKISDSHIGKQKSMETRKRMSEARKGIVFSDNTKEKMKIAALKRWRKQKEESGVS